MKISLLLCIVLVSLTTCVGGGKECVIYLPTGDKYLSPKIKEFSPTTLTETGYVFNLNIPSLGIDKAKLNPFFSNKGLAGGDIKLDEMYSEDLLLEYISLVTDSSIFKTKEVIDSLYSLNHLAWFSAFKIDKKENEISYFSEKGLVIKLEKLRNKSILIKFYCR
ncbi:hypothetical protein [Brumimicrobium oceani]|nr:hypothetical protein [Brumimicrobium oceani]